MELLDISVELFIASKNGLDIYYFGIGIGLSIPLNLYL